MRETAARALEEARRGALDALGRRTQLQDTLARGEAELNSLEYRVRRSHAQMTKAEDQLRFAQEESDEVRRRVAQVQRRRDTLEGERMGLHALQARTDEDIQRLSRASQDLQREMENRRSRLTALEGLRESGEGLSAGARAVLTTLRHELNLAGEVHGLVAECLSVDPRLEKAVEAALGSHIETIIVESARAAKMLSARLSEQELGRAMFLPLDRAEAAMLCRRPLTPPARPCADGCLGCAADLISCDERYRSVAQALLGHVLVYENELAASEAFSADKGSGGWTRVSLSGELYESNGTIGGGRHKPQRLGLIGRKNEIARLGVQMDELRMQIEALAERNSFMEKRAQQLSRDDERIGADLSALALTYTELKGMLAAIEREESRSTEEKNLAVQEIHELEAERTAHLDRVTALRTELEEWRRKESEASALAQSLEAGHAQHETRLASLREQLAEMERDAATWR